MTSDQGNKTCGYCAETVPAAAKLCPRCRQWLSFWSFRNPTILVFGMALPMFGMFFLMTHTLNNTLNPRPFYSDFPKAIRILESRIQWAETSDGLYVYITGVVTNESSAAWSNVEFDARFYDSNGRLIDAAEGRGGVFTILPSNDAGFRVAVKPLLSSNNYNSFEISVSNARSTRGPF